MSAERLSPERLAEIDRYHREHTYETQASRGADPGIVRCNVDALLAHIDALQECLDKSQSNRYLTELEARIEAQQAEIARLEGMVAALRRELIDLGFHGLDHHPDCDGDDDCFCQRLDALADTETAAKAHDQRERLAGAREFARRWNDEMEASSRNPFTVLDVLADMEREAADGR